MIFLLAGTYDQYKHYLRENNISPLHAKYVDSEGRCLLGTINPQVIYYGTYYDRPEIETLRELISTRQIGIQTPVLN